MTQTGEVHPASGASVLGRGRSGLNGSRIADRSNGASTGPARPVRRHFKILTLVEEPPGLSEVPQLLARDGFVVASCRNPREALDLIADDIEVGIIVCDIQLPDTRGPQFFHRAMERVADERPLSVIFLAEAASINDVVAAIRLQAVDFLRKPTHPPALLEAARRADHLLHRRSTERVMLRRATDLLDVMRAFVDWLPATPAVLNDDSAMVAHNDQVLAVSLETDRALALERTRKELRRVKRMLKAQKAQRKIFGVELVANPCWDMLLDLYENMLLGRMVSVSSLALASGVPVTTALRRMGKLEDMGLVRRGKDASDARRVFVDLTDAGLEKIGQFFEALDD